MAERDRPGRTCATAWNRVHIDRYFFNTRRDRGRVRGWSSCVVATTAGYALSVLRPRYAGILTGLVLATLFVPAVVLLVPLYLDRSSIRRSTASR